MPNKKLACDYFEVDCPHCGEVNNLYPRKGKLDGPHDTMHVQCHECEGNYEITVEWYYKVITLKKDSPE